MLRPLVDELKTTCRFMSVFVVVLQASVRDQKKLLVENAKLKKDIEQLRTQLQEKQRRRAGTRTHTHTHTHTRYIHLRSLNDILH